MPKSTGGRLEMVRFHLTLTSSGTCMTHLSYVPPNHQENRPKVRYWRKTNWKHQHFEMVFQFAFLQHSLSVPAQHLKNNTSIAGKHRANDAFGYDSEARSRLWD